MSRGKLKTWKVPSLLILRALIDIRLFNLTLKIEALCVSETSIAIHHTTRRNLTQDLSFHQHRFGNAKSLKYTALCWRRDCENDLHLAVSLRINLSPSHSRYSTPFFFLKVFVLWDLKCMQVPPQSSVNEFQTRTFGSRRKLVATPVILLWEDRITQVRDGTTMLSADKMLTVGQTGDAGQICRSSLEAGRSLRFGRKYIMTCQNKYFDIFYWRWQLRLEFPAGSKPWEQELT